MRPFASALLFIIAYLLVAILGSLLLLYIL